jgi:selenocysteine lyase/cysteine desulfurase
MPKTDAFTELELGVFAALETYSNVHRGSGYNSLVSTHLFELARAIVLEYMGLTDSKYVVIFCSPGGSEALMAKLKPENYQSISSHDFGLPLGVRALAIKRRSLPEGVPFQTGGGTTTLVSPGWVIWAKAPDKFEAGTPPIINIITFARALLLIRKSGKDIFLSPASEKLTADDILFHDKLENYSGRELLEELRKTLIGQDINVPSAEGLRPYINLDNSASTPTFIPVWNTVCQTWRQPEQIQQEIIQQVESICSEALDAPITDYDMIFTSNTTEAINLAAESLSRESDPGIEPVILSSLLEHTSNDLPWRMIRKFSMIRLQIDPEGFLDLNELERVLSDYNQKGQHGKKRIKLMAVSGCSNVLGSFNNLQEISQIAHKYEVHLMVDAAQMVAHRKIEMARWGIDYLAFSAHKVYAPFGTGILFARKGFLNLNQAELRQIQSKGKENTGGIAALGKSLLIMKRIGMDVIREDEQALTRITLNGLKKIDGLKIYGVNDPDSPGFSQKGGVIVFTMKGLMSDKVAKELAVRGGIGVRYGCHCAHILVKHILGVPPWLEKFQRIIARLFPRLRFPGVARVSFGIQTTERDIDNFIQIVGKIATRTSIPKRKEVEEQIKEYVKASTLKVYSQL